MSEKLDVDELVERAGVEAPDFLDGLRVLVTALNEEARLSPTGARLVGNQLTASLVTQARLRAPDTPLDRPVIVTCLPRMGSTWLHNLLSALPGVHAPRTWELNTPEACTAGPDARAEAIRRARAATREHDELAPGMTTIHPVTPTGPEECHRLLSHTFHSHVFASRCHVPSYADWLKEADVRPAYEFHRRALRAIAAGAGANRLVLKCPFHIWHLPELTATYPDARIVVLHRDLDAALNSMRRMAAVLRALRSDDVRADEIDDHWTKAYAEGAELAEAATGPNVRHVRYEDLVADTPAVLREIAEFAELEVPDGFTPPALHGGSSFSSASRS